MAENFFIKINELCSIKRSKIDRLDVRLNLGAGAIQVLPLGVQSVETRWHSSQSGLRTGRAAMIAMSLEHLYPFAGDNAIQNAIFAFEFGAPVGPGHLKAFVDVVPEALGSEFPDLQPQHAMSVNLNATPGLSVPSVRTATSVEGYVLNKPASVTGGSLRSIALSSNALLVSISDYSRWQEVFSDVQRYCGLIFPALRELPLKAVGLQYVDVLTWKADPKTLVLSEILLEDSPLLARNIFALPPDSFWHSHHGFWVDHEAPVPYRQTDNLNINKMTVRGAQGIQILGSHRAQFKEKLWWDGQIPLSDSLWPLFVKLHEDNKDILRQTLSVEVRKKIKLV